MQVDWEPGPTEIVPNWAPHPILQTLVQVDWEPGPTEIVPNWAPRPILQTLVQVDWEPGPTESVPNWARHTLRPALVIGMHFSIFIIMILFMYKGDQKINGRKALIY